MNTIVYGWIVTGSQPPFPPAQTLGPSKTPLRRELIESVGTQFRILDAAGAVRCEGVYLGPDGPQARVTLDDLAPGPQGEGLRIEFRGATRVWERL